MLFDDQDAKNYCIGQIVGSPIVEVTETKFFQLTRLYYDVS